MHTMNILLVEDDLVALEMIEGFLTKCGFEVEGVSTATDAVSYLSNHHYDLLILDINLPDYTGYEVLKTLKNQRTLPIIVVSADNNTSAKIIAFKYGAKDYMVKPIDLEELEARIWVQLSHTSQIETPEPYARFQCDGSTIRFDQTPLKLTHTEFVLLSNLIKHKNQTLSRALLLESISSISSNRALDNHIKNLRKKIPNGHHYLRTEYGVGYKLSY